MNRMMSVALAIGTAVCCANVAGPLYAQAAGAGADFNKADRKEVAKQKEIERLKKVDPPIKPDPVGNALIGGAASGVIRGAAAGASSVVTGTATGTAANKVKDAKNESKEKK